MHPGSAKNDVSSENHTSLVPEGPGVGPHGAPAEALTDGG